MPQATLSSHHIRLIATVASVTMLAFFDYALVFYLKEVIADNFFGGREVMWLYSMQAVGLFLGAYIAHPIGGFLLGQYGDANGRRAVLFLSLLGLTVFTFIIAVLPTYHHLGVLAPILFIVARFGQGLAYGGQIPSALVLLTEQLPMRRVGLGCSFVVVGVLIGVLLVSLLSSFLANILSYADMLSYGWRIPFVIGGVLSASLLLSLHTLKETSIDVQTKDRHAEAGHTLSAMSFDGLTKTQIQDLADANIFHDDKPQSIQKSSLVQIITKNRPSSLIPAVLISWIMLSVFIVIATIMPMLLNISFAVSESILVFGSGLAVFFMMIGCAFYGYLMDRVNVGKVMIFGGIFFIVNTSLFFVQLGLGSDLMLLWFALLGFSGGMIATLPVVLVRLFPSKIRLTSIALTYNVTYALVAGGVPSLLAFATFHLPLAPALYLLWVGLLTIFLSFYIYYLPRSERDIAR
ncbi:MFS transporter [Moraxella bovis]|uniref:Proline porter II n=1 Tax=Moraxella bovis TaxID=476 RepID=A0A378PZ73_MORBO|nr:MFS transporter [Moraxella bovis]STY93484.1 Proline porter II [Moraxella bovis]